MATFRDSVLDFKFAWPCPHIQRNYTNSPISLYKYCSSALVLLIFHGYHKFSTLSLLWIVLLCWHKMEYLISGGRGCLSYSFAIGLLLSVSPNSMWTMVCWTDGYRVIYDSLSSFWYTPAPPSRHLLLIHTCSSLVSPPSDTHLLFPCVSSILKAPSDLSLSSSQILSLVSKNNSW